MPGLRTMRTVWIRPWTTSTVSTLLRLLLASGRCGPADGGFSGVLRERGEVRRVALTGPQERERLLGRDALCIPKRRVGRASQPAGLAVDPPPLALEPAGRGVA